VSGSSATALMLGSAPWAVRAREGALQEEQENEAMPKKMDKQVQYKYTLWTPPASCGIHEKVAAVRQRGECMSGAF